MAAPQPQPMMNQAMSQQQPLPPQQPMMAQAAPPQQQQFVTLQAPSQGLQSSTMQTISAPQQQQQMVYSSQQQPLPPQQQMYPPQPQQYQPTYQQLSPEPPATQLQADTLPTAQQYSSQYAPAPSSVYITTTVPASATQDQISSPQQPLLPQQTEAPQTHTTPSVQQPQTTPIQPSSPRDNRKRILNWAEQSQMSSEDLNVLQTAMELYQSARKIVAPSTNCSCRSKEDDRRAPPKRHSPTYKKDQRDYHHPRDYRDPRDHRDSYSRYYRRY